MDILDSHVDDGVMVWDEVGRVPRTDEEVKACVSWMYRDLPVGFRNAAWGYYRCRRKMGTSVDDAWLEVLRVIVGEKKSG